tara:strand:- start:1408 stop:1659 length:252 start_codon:yes stop_codon:yes gene_type:complete
MTKTKKESMSNRIFLESVDLDYKILDKATQLIEALKKHKISSWKTKNNEHALIIELDILLDEKYEHIAALNVVEELEKRELRK